ncbi:MAG: 50S ribosomal protein L3, partial [Nanoarchaeota archaeon]
VAHIWNRVVCSIKGHYHPSPIDGKCSSCSKKVGEITFSKEQIDKLEKEKMHEITDVQLVCYSEAKKTEIKKTPDISEIAISGQNLAEKINFAKEHLAKEFSVADVFTKGIVDIRGVTKGKGFAGAVKRFGVHYRSHKAEKGQKKVGSIGAWHPHGVRFTVPRPGQLGVFSRVTYNVPVVTSKKFVANDHFLGKRVFDNYGMIRTDYIAVAGSIQGSQKRQVIIAAPLRPSKKQIKKNYELLELR